MVAGSVSRWRQRVQDVAARVRAEVPAVREMVQRVANLPHAQPAAEPATVVAEVPVELLFTEGPNHGPVEGWTPELQAQHDRWADLPLARLRPHLGLFDYFLQQGPHPREYLDWYAGIFTSRGLTPPMSEEALLSSRHREFVRMEDALQRDPAFFSRTAMRAEWSGRGYFNIRDGHHRAAFLFRRGWRRLPVSMSREDLAAWGAGVTQALRDEIFTSDGTRLLYTPVLLSDFLGLPSERDGYGPSRLDLFLRHLGDHRLAGSPVLDIGCNTGFYAQHFAREGARVTGIEPDPRHARLARLLNQAYGLTWTLREETFEDAALEPHDVGILLSVFYHFAKDPQVRARFLQKVDATVKRFLFWESGAEPEQERQWILEGTGFKRYRQLGQTWGTGKARELGVFER